MWYLKLEEPSPATNLRLLPVVQHEQLLRPRRQPGVAHLPSEVGEAVAEDAELDVAGPGPQVLLGGVDLEGGEGELEVGAHVLVDVDVGAGGDGDGGHAGLVLVHVEGHHARGEVDDGVLRDLEKNAKCGTVFLRYMHVRKSRPANSSTVSFNQILLF